MVTLVMTLVAIMVIGHDRDDGEAGHGDDGEPGWVGGSGVSRGANYFRVVPSLILAFVLITCLAIVIMLVIIMMRQIHNISPCNRMSLC